MQYTWDSCTKDFIISFQVRNEIDCRRKSSVSAISTKLIISNFAYDFHAVPNICFGAKQPYHWLGPPICSISIHQPCSRRFSAKIVIPPKWVALPLIYYYRWTRKAQYEKHTSVLEMLNNSGAREKKNGTCENARALITLWRLPRHFSAYFNLLFIDSSTRRTRHTKHWIGAHDIKLAMVHILRHNGMRWSTTTMVQGQGKRRGPFKEREIRYLSLKIKCTIKIFYFI